MRNVLIYSSLVLTLAAALTLFTNAGVLWGQEEETTVTSKGKAGRNLQVLAIDSIVNLQNEMKVLTKSLGVDCKFCHELKDFTKDLETLHKDKAREMMKMVDEINVKFFKNSKIKITCFTCHRGHKEPVMTAEEWAKIMEMEKEK